METSDKFKVHYTFTNFHNKHCTGSVAARAGRRKGELGTVELPEAFSAE